MVKERKKAKERVFHAQAFLDSAGVARKVKEFKKAEFVYSQGDTADSVMYLQKGSVKLMEAEIVRQSVDPTPD